ncbi:TolB-like translocation protein [Bdellovibrio svalbardensis]|uniref:TolB protein n=1 Tax=Bdellovibrio svalbardensis TaxID=2972972 RepID=A0ABT6DJ86_9BACT|nr:hypothetical protein [Bdellovibrio svalbardensis]MDG0816925.1 hypothetical protein [Bdellovibrio svalbardensis]
MHNCLRILSSIILLCLLALRTEAQWEVRPEIQWKVIHTPHFEVIYDANQQDLGLLYAEKLEKAFYQLRSYFSEAPEKISVVINDKTDITNGYATRLPYPHIMAYPVMPGPEESLADTGDWAFELLAHEYTHVLNFEPAGGVMKPLRAIFGNVIAPNLLLPTWWKEGLAVNMETRLGKFGRLRSTYQESAIRAMVEDQTLFNFDLAQVNEMIPSWPEGMRPYLFGSLMWSQMIADQGEKVVDELNQRHGRRVPYFVETPAREYLGVPYQVAYGTAMSQTSERAMTQLKTLREEKPTPMTIAKNSYQYISAPSISPSGKHLAFIAEDDSNSRSVKILSREDLQQSFLDSKTADTIEKFDQNLSPPLSSPDEPMSGSIQRVSWFPDSKRLVYDKIDLTNRVESFSDLYVYNLETKNTEHLSHGLRAREPAVSTDGNLIAFVKLSGGKTQLAVMKLDQESKPVEILVAAPMEERISYPTFVNAQELVFSWRNNEGSEHLYRYSFTSGKVEAILSDYPNARYARMTSEGLLFASNKNGTNNLYLADANLLTARPITHALTAFFMSDIDPARKDIFATTMTSKGFKVASILKQDWEQTPKELPQISPMFGDRLPAVTNDSEATAAAKSAVASAEIKDYSPYGYLWPQYWIPFIVGSSSETGIVLQAMTSGFDPLKKHSYSLMGSWDTRLNKGSIQGTYLNQTTPLPFALSAYRRASYLGDVNNNIEDTSLSLAALPDMFWLSRYASLQMGWQNFERSTDTSSTKRTGPFAMLSYTNYTQSGAQISPESGGGVYFGIFDFIPKDDYLTHWQYWLGGEKYLNTFLPKHHALMIRAKGVYTPEKIPSLYGVSTDALVFIPDNPLPEYIMRGYQRGQFFGRNLANVNLEYRFPFWNIYRGSGTDPLFLRRISGALVGDGVATDGLFVNTDTGKYESVSMSRSFWSAGFEARIETTIGYVFPVTLVVGVYDAFNAPKGPETVVGSSLQISGF